MDVPYSYINWLGIAGCDCTLVMGSGQAGALFMSQMNSIYFLYTPGALMMLQSINSHTSVYYV